MKGTFSTYLRPPMYQWRAVQILHRDLLLTGFTTFAQYVIFTPLEITSTSRRSVGIEKIFPWIPIFTISL